MISDVDWFAEFLWKVKLSELKAKSYDETRYLKSEAEIGELFFR